MAERFRVEFMEEAADFLGNLPIKTREKVLFNIWKARNSMIENSSGNSMMTFGNSEHSIKRPISGSLHFGISMTVLIQS